MNWSTYVNRLTRGQTQQQVADHIKVADQTTVGRWRRGSTTPKDPAIVAAFAQAYGGNVLEAFVAAGFLTREEAGMPAAHGIDFETLVDDDDALSENAKIHLKNQYGLLKAASAVDRAHAMRDSILNDPELDEATRARLLKSFDSTSATTTIYSSTATVVEHPFPRVDVSWADRAASEIAQSYVAALLLETGDSVEAAEALNDRLVEQGRVPADLGREATIFISHATGSGKTAAMLAALLQNVPQPFDLDLTAEDHEFLARIGVTTHVADPAAGSGRFVAKAARTMQSAGRATRRQQDAEAEDGQD